MAIKRVLITGSNSYVGTNVEKWLMKEPDKFYVETISVRGEAWKSFDFSKFDVVFHVAGIAHVKETKKNKDLYFKVNRDLAFEVAAIAKKNNVKQFIFMSSLSVYGIEGSLRKIVEINNESIEDPKTFYGSSKFEAEKKILKLNSKIFKVCIVRPPMIYGKNAPGNFRKLYNLIKFFRLFPKVKNSRSLLNIEFLSLKIEHYITNDYEGYYFPQDEEYSSTSQIVDFISKMIGKRVHLSSFLGLLISLFLFNNPTIRKLFGSLVINKDL
jgi:UDP-glucose 4-epimerase